MRRTLRCAPLLALALAGCGMKYEGDGGWTTLIIPGQLDTLQYNVAGGGKFVALCDPQEGVTFSLIGGGNPRDAQHFVVTAGSWRHEFETYGVQQDTGLVMMPAGTSGSAEEATDRKAIEQALAATQVPIVFSAAGGWSRTVPASSKIGAFERSCHAPKRG